MTTQKKQSYNNYNCNNEESKEQPRFTRIHRIRYEQNMPQQFANNLVPSNAFEQKDRFLRRNLTPEFHLNVPTSELESALLHSSSNITFTLFREATRILNIVCRRFKSIDNFIEESFGPRISIDVATEKITEYINESNLPTNLDVIWCEDLIGSALMCSTGIDRNGNIPRHRKFTMLLKTNEENTYLRERGIINLMDHEIGTHYHRSFNEGLQPWYGKRDIYGLAPTNTNEAIKIEEGLACVHTILKARYKYLGVPALLYYGSCMAEYLPFKDLFEHLGKYITNEEQRWKHCMRIKRCLPSQDLCGGYGKDQRYFEGAVTILRQQANIDFSLLMAGKLTLNEIDRVRRCVITSSVRYPTFMQNREKYLTTLRMIAKLNGIPLAKRTQDRNRPRSLGLPVADHRTNPDGISMTVSGASSAVGFKTPNQRHSRGSRHTSSGSDIDDHSKRTSETFRSKSCTSRPKSPHLSTESAGHEIVNHPRDRSSERSNKGSEGPRTCSLHSLETSNCKTENKQTTRPHHPDQIKKQIICALADLDLPSKHLSNAVNCRPIEPKGEGYKCVPKNRTQNSKEYFESECITMENALGPLPHGVCGCRLFTSGSLKPLDKDYHACITNRSSKVDSATDTFVRSTEALAPIVLEIDLRHPLIGV